MQTPNKQGASFIGTEETSCESSTEAPGLSCRSLSRLLSLKFRAELHLLVLLKAPILIQHSRRGSTALGEAVGVRNKTHIARRNIAGSKISFYYEQMTPHNTCRGLTSSSLHILSQQWCPYTEPHNNT